MELMLLLMDFLEVDPGTVKNLKFLKEKHFVCFYLKICTRGLIVPRLTKCDSLKNIFSYSLFIFKPAHSFFGQPLVFCPVCFFFTDASPI